MKTRSRRSIIPTLHTHCGNQICKKDLVHAHTTARMAVR